MPERTYRTGGEACASAGALARPRPAPADSFRARQQPAFAKPERWSFQRDRHALTYAGLFAFTAVLFFRPYELFPALATFSGLAMALGLFTLLAYVPSQLALEGTLTARPREVVLVLMLCGAGVLSIPLAIDRGVAVQTLTETFIKAVLMFIVIVNAVRTERRLMGLLFLSLAVSCFLSLNAVNDMRLGRNTVEGYRVGGSLGGMFGNPNDMAVHLVTMVPVAVALMLTADNRIARSLFGACAALMVAGIIVTYSRGGFLGLVFAVLVLVWKIGRRNRAASALLLALGLLGTLAIAPGNYMGRLASIVDPSLDEVGSASMRRELLFRSVGVALRNPVTGVGMGNFPVVSVQKFVSHIAYTQVAAEMGLAALVIYTLFMVSPLRRLQQIETETEGDRRHRRPHYLAIGLQASLVGYMVSTFFVSVAYLWYVYYLVGYAVCLRRIYESRVPSPESGRVPESHATSVGNR
jgi:hypothetical protein